MVLGQDNLKPIGGTIFYINTSVDGEYKFYDKDRKETTDLTKAVYYEVIRQGTKDKFYVVDTKTGLTGPYRWCHMDQDLGIKGTGIGFGKYNTKVAMITHDTGAYKDHNLWEEVERHNTDSVNGQSDWFIGSKDEIEELIKSGLVDKWFEKKKWKKRDPILIWSSSERNHPNTVWYWDEKLTDRNHWYRQIKDWGCSTCFIRSF
jgi:hypothetical protein